MNINIINLADNLTGHPVHRATELLRERLVTVLPSTPDQRASWDAYARDDFDAAEDDLGYIDEFLEAPLADDEHVPVLVSSPEALPAFLRVSGDNETAGTFADSTPDEAGSVQPSSLAEEEDAGDIFDQPPHVQLRGLVRSFKERQRQAALLVTVSVTAASVLTLGSVILLLSLVGPATAGG